MKRLRASLSNKLKGNAGESIAEVLIALLIAALALTMLASVISAAAKMITESKEKVSQYYAANDNLTAHTPVDESSYWTVTVKNASNAAVKLTNAASESSITVRYNVNNVLSNKPVVAFWK